MVIKILKIKFIGLIVLDKFETDPWHKSIMNNYGEKVYSQLCDLLVSSEDVIWR